MWQLAAALAEIALRRRGPDSLPDSSFLVLLLLACYLAVAVVSSVMFAGGLDLRTLARLAADMLLFFAFVYAVLRFFRLERRYRQTVSALLGAGIVINLAFLPVAGIGLAMGFAILETPFVWFGIAFELWAIFVSATILARSLSQPLIFGFMIEILFLLTSFSVGELIAPSAEIVATDAA